MGDEPSRGVPSTASLFHHPIHPMLVPFPIAFLIGALASDLAFWAAGDPFWARASLWLIGAGLVMGALAAVAGLIDFLTIRRARQGLAGWVHFLGNASVLILALINFVLRIGDPAAAVLPKGLVLSLIIAGLLGVTGWMGGELAYRRKIGVIEGDLAGTRAASLIDERTRTVASD
jgi:uncharacterized membrane protein